MVQAPLAVGNGRDRPNREKANTRTDDWNRRLLSWDKARAPAPL